MIFIKKQTTPPQLFLDAIAGLKPVYQLIDGKYWIIVPAKNSTPKKIQAEHYSAHILQATLDLMKQNRHEDNSNERNSLIHLRGVVYKDLVERFQNSNLTNEQLLRKYHSMKNSSEYQEFISLVTFLYAKEFRRRNIDSRLINPV